MPGFSRQAEFSYLLASGQSLINLMVGLPLTFKDRVFRGKLK